jgi:hypothetical protein
VLGVCQRRVPCFAAGSDIIPDPWTHRAAKASLHKPTVPMREASIRKRNWILHRARKSTAGVLLSLERAAEFA